MAKKIKSKRNLKDTKKASSLKGIRAPKTASPALANLIGVSRVSQVEAVKLIWDYIKENGLSQGRTILVDGNLSKLVGNKKSIDMFELPGAISRNLD